MNGLSKGLVLVLAFLAISQLGLAMAQPSPVDTSIQISSPEYIPYQNEQYENTTAILNINVILVYGEYDQSWIGSVHLDSVCYSLDGQPLVYIEKFVVENYTDYGVNEQDFFVYTASIRLVDLSEGSHTVTAYANDTHNEYAYLNTRSASYSFTVNSSNSPTPSPSPTVPEISWLVVVPLLLSVFAVAVVVRYRKTAKSKQMTISCFCI